MHPTDWKNPYPSIRVPVFARRAVATSHPLAAQAGLAMLQAGGNAIDATIAAAATLTIVEPVSCGLGSDAFALVWHQGRLHGLNSSGPAPAAWKRDDIAARFGAAMPQRGWGAVTVPGMVAGWMALHERFGRLPLERVLAPAIEYAERGHGVAAIVAHKWAAQVPVLKDQPGFAEHFMPQGRAPRAGERFRLPDAGATLRRIAASSGRDFYEGETAAKLVAHAAAHGGGLSAADLAGFTPEWVEPISQAYRGHVLHEIPPNGQGIAALMALGMLSHFDLASMPADSADVRHLQIEAMKLAFEDVYAHVADRAHMRVPVEALLDDAYLARRARLIDPKRAGEPTPGLPPPGGTIYLTAADDEGTMVSFIQSNFMGFGSGVVVPGTGVSLQNRGAGFSLDPAHANCAAPGKRPFHTIIPAFLTKDGEPVMSFGVMGGNMQPQGHVQTLSRMLDHGQNLQAACDAPRWKVNRGLSVDVEGTMEPAVVAELAARGHRIERIEDPYMDFGSGQFIQRLSADPEDGYVAASDPRRDGQVAGC